jgi:hypothetical protein
MPGTDARSGLSNPRATAELDNPGSELAHEEGLATALSAFLSQLRASATAAPALYAPDPGPAAVQALRASRLPSLASRAELTSAGGKAHGRLPHRLREDPGVDDIEVLPDSAPNTQPARPLLPGFRTARAPGVVARVAPTDAWATPEPATEAEAARRPAAVETRPWPAAQPQTTIDAPPATAAPAQKVDRPAAARAAAVAQLEATLAARTLRARPVPEIAVDDLPEPWLGTGPEDKAEQGRPQQAGHEPPLSLLGPPTLLNVASVTNEPPAVSEPTVAQEPPVLADPRLVHKPAALHEPTLMNEPTVANSLIAVPEPALVHEPTAEHRQNVLDEPMEAHEQLLLLSGSGGQVIAPAPEASRQRKAAVAGLALAIFAATTLGISVYWGYRTNDTLNQRNLELAATQDSLGAVQDSLTQAQSTLLRQHQSYAALKAGIKQVAQRYVATKTQLEQVQIDLGRTQGQLTQAQGQVGRAQNQLGNTQQNLSTTQSHALQIQRGTLLLQQTVQLLASLIVLENNYITAAQTHNGAAMKSDLAEMRTLEYQAQTLEPTAAPPTH